MFKAVFLAAIVAVTVWTTRSDNSKESLCIEETEVELREYVKLESWQELFRQHLKFVVDKDGEILSERNRLKFNTIIHNAIFGCNHDRDDEVDDCPNIFKGSIKSCKRGRNLRAAMFRSARCVFVQSSVKHLVLSDAMLDAYPLDQLDRISDDADKPIREFGETVVNMLSTLSHGETGGLGELMSLNLYLNNKYGTVFMHKVPAEPVTSPEDFRTARTRMRKVHRAILDKLHTFWDTWCSDSDVEAHYRRRFEDAAYAALVAKLYENINETDELIRSLNVSSHAVDLDFDPRKVALADYVEHVVARGSMPGRLLVDMELASFEASFEFDPRAVYEYQVSLFRPIYTCFYWTTIAHLKLAARLMDETDGRAVAGDRGAAFAVDYLRFARPLAVFHASRRHFVSALSPDASDNVTRLLSFLLDTSRALKRNPRSVAAISSSRPVVREFIDALSADMETMLQAKVPDDYFHGLGREEASRLMRSNYKAFARLVSATSAFKEDRVNSIKLKRFMFFLSEAVDFDHGAAADGSD